MREHIRGKIGNTIICNQVGGEDIQVGPFTKRKTQSHTVFPSGHVHVLAESGMSDGFEDLETSQDFDGVGGEREAITTTDIMRKR